MKGTKKQDMAMVMILRRWRGLVAGWMTSGRRVILRRMNEMSFPNVESLIHDKDEISVGGVYETRFQSLILSLFFISIWGMWVGKGLAW